MLFVVVAAFVLLISLEINEAQNIAPLGIPTLQYLSFFLTLIPSSFPLPFSNSQRPPSISMWLCH